MLGVRAWPSRDGHRQPPTSDERRGGRGGGGGVRQATPFHSAARRTSGRASSGHRLLSGFLSARSAACESTIRVKSKSNVVLLNKHLSQTNTILTLSLFVLQYSLAYACLKLVNYSFFFWLPFYLSNNYGWKEAEADRLSVWYDVGGIIGKWHENLCILFHPMFHHGLTQKFCC